MNIRTKRQLNHLVAAVACLLVSLAMVCPRVFAQSDAQIKALLLFDERVKKLDPGLEEVFQKRKIETTIRPLGKPLSPEMLRLFPLVILPDFDGLKPPQFAVGKSLHSYYAEKRNIDLILEYVRDGGGLVFSPSVRGGGQQTVRGCSAILEPLDAKLIAAQIRDDQRSVVDGNYSWTTNIDDSAVSKGVERIAYPTNLLRWDDAYATVPLTTEDPAWQPVVRGMPKSIAARGLKDEWFPVNDHKSPAMAAIRPFGKGRVAVLTLNPAYTFEKGLSEIERGWLGEAHVGPVNGIFLEKGDEKGRSDGLQLILNMVRWTASAGVKAGFGGYTQEKLAALPEPKKPDIPGWLKGWNTGNAKPQKILIGARSRYSNGKGSVKDFASAAQDAGCSVLVMSETFEDMKAKDWPQFVDDCRSASSEKLVVLPGIDIPDIYLNRYILFGQPTFPQPFMLNEAGDALKELQYLAHGFGTHFAAIHRPSTTPMVHQLYKFFQGISVYTYKDGEVVDDARLAYEWQANSASLPIPIVVHEFDSPEKVQKAASTGHQLYVWADTPRNAAWYARAGAQHYWASPSHFLVTSGPMISALGRKSAQSGTVTVESEAPIVDVQLRNHRFAERRWRPNARKARLDYHLPWSHLRWNILWVEDARGRTAITPPMKFGPTQRYTFRCSDRQNFFGWAWRYPGTRQRGASITAWGTHEGRGTWPHGGGVRRGENMAPLLEFPYASPEVYITDVILDQRYWRANWRDVGYDAGSQQGTTRSRVYQGRVRYLDFKKDKEHITRDRTWMVRDWWLRLRMPVAPEGPVFPGLTSVGRKPLYGYTDPESGKYVTGKLEKGHLDLPPGSWVGRKNKNVLVSLKRALRVTARGKVGIAAPKDSGAPVPVGTTWKARYVIVPHKEIEDVLSYMGFGSEVPYRLQLSRGSLEKIALMAEIKPDGYGAAGNVEPAKKFPLPYPLPVMVHGLNPNWEAGLWRPDGKLDRFGIFERVGRAELDVTKEGKFYAGNLITADNPRLRLSIAEWKKDLITVVANNPTTSDITTFLKTPREIDNKYRLEAEAKIPAGKNIHLTFPQNKE
ncbi:MAG: hypothetical protein ACLFWL_14010 [Candidatus Brocadiia bacterium]